MEKTSIKDELTTIVTAVGIPSNEVAQVVTDLESVILNRVREKLLGDQELIDSLQHSEDIEQVLTTLLLQEKYQRILLTTTQEVVTDWLSSIGASLDPSAITSLFELVTNK